MHTSTGRGTDTIAVVRLNPDGSPDATFNRTGSVALGLSAAYGWAVALQPDGKILVGGSAGSADVVARLNPDGSLDTTFGNTSKQGKGGGIWLYDPNTASPDEVDGLAVLTDGAGHVTGIVAGGLGSTARARRSRPSS